MNPSTLAGLITTGKRLLEAEPVDILRESARLGFTLGHPFGLDLYACKETNS